METDQNKMLYLNCFSNSFLIFFFIHSINMRIKKWYPVQFSSELRWNFAETQQNLLPCHNGKTIFEKKNERSSTMRIFIFLSFHKMSLIIRGFSDGKINCGKRKERANNARATSVSCLRKPTIWKSKNPIRRMRKFEKEFRDYRAPVA